MLTPDLHSKGECGAYTDRLLPVEGSDAFLQVKVLASEQVEQATHLQRGVLAARMASLPSHPIPEPEAETAHSAVSGSMPQSQKHEIFQYRLA